MTLDEAINHAEEVAEEKQLKAHNLKQCRDYGNPKSTITSGVAKCEKCAEEHRQLAEWLKELKMLREQNKWIPVNERLPELGQDVLGIDPYDDVMQVCTYDDCGEIKWVSDRGSNTLIVAWRPLPEPYQEESEIN